MTAITTWKDRGQSRFDSAIDDGHGAVDAGYLGMMQFTRLAIGAVCSMIVGLFVQQYFDPDHKFDARMLGEGTGLVASAYALYLGGVAAFKRFDRDVPPIPGSSSLTLEQHGDAPPVPVIPVAIQPAAPKPKGKR